jgi:hypothetical protein
MRPLATDWKWPNLADRACTPKRPLARKRLGLCDRLVADSRLAQTGHKRSVAMRTQVRPRRAPERQVSGHESEPCFGSIRPPAVSR